MVEGFKGGINTVVSVLVRNIESIRYGIGFIAGLAFILCVVIAVAVALLQFAVHIGITLNILDVAAWADGKIVLKGHYIPDTTLFGTKRKETPESECKGCFYLIDKEEKNYPCYKCYGKEYYVSIQSVEKTLDKCRKHE